MGNWAQREMLSQRRDFKKRLQCLRYFIQIVEILQKGGDFSGAYAIFSALTSIPVSRLKRYFAELTKQEHLVLKQSRELFSVTGNYPKLRATMKNFLAKACVPHIGLFTRDLTMLAEQNSTKMVEGVKYINFGKCETLDKQIVRLKMYQNNINKFDFKLNESLMIYMESELNAPLKTENELWKISTAVEPREPRANSGNK